MIIVVGEMYNIRTVSASSVDSMTVPVDPLRARRGWRLEMALYLEAFRSGPSRTRLDRLGLRWDASLNLVPPSTKWDALGAKRMAEALVTACLSPNPTHYAPRLKYAARFDLLLMGVRVCDAFGIVDSGRLLFQRVLELDGRLCMYPWPHPSGRSRVWSPAVWDRARAHIGDLACGTGSNSVSRRRRRVSNGRLDA